MPDADYMRSPESISGTVKLMREERTEAAALIQQQQATIERLSAALAFYADERNWRSVTVYMCGHGAINCNVMADKGSKARTALWRDAK
jgi:hypothetical protein